MRDNPSTTLPGRSPGRALTFMRQRKTDTLLVGDDSGKLLGIVSAYDVSAQLDNVTTIEEIMKAPEIVLQDTATARDALALITEAPFGIIPVVTGAGEITGIVTRSSLLTAFAAQWVGDEENI
ncbi:Glycine betaine/carnitine/choline transport ATP-binding protein OpuCA [compost metagenome]